MRDLDSDAKERIARCLEGDRAAWDGLFESRRPLLAETIRRTLRRYDAPADGGTVDDLIQDVWLSLVKNDFAALRRFDPEGVFASYLIAIAVHRTIDHLHRERRLGVSVEGAREALRADDLLPVRADLDLVERALAELSHRERLALRLFYWQEVSTDGIGRMLGLPPGSVRSLLARSRDRMKEILSRFAGLLL
jgi:RNA polymerase sigma-70 factor, ECF subfamily